ncbi:MAG TPA: DUF5667 domain-containing protein [Candidatus Paceibacterota bacterium]|jgi:hypothetical protein|nr:DUF5667 domain-containing protein [Candidatus Paceibacterota bacterium]
MKKIEDIFNTLPKAVMTAEERTRIREAVSTFIAEHPVVSPLVAARISPFTKLLSLDFVQAHAFQALALILLVACGGITVAAQNALPGDPLYAVKLNVNEELPGLFAFSTQAKADYEAGLAERRLNEVTSLSAEGKLTPEARTQIEANLQAHVDNVEKSVNKLQSENDARGAVEVSSDLASTLHAHEQVLLDLSSRSDEAGEVASTLRQQLGSISDHLTDLEEQVAGEETGDSEARARTKSEQAEDELSAAKSARADATTSVSEDVLDDADAQIDHALSELADGYTSLQNGSFNKAFVDFQSVIRYSKEAEVIIKAGVKYDLPADNDGDNASTTPEEGSTTPSEATSTDSLGATTTNATGTPTTTDESASTSTGEAGTSATTSTSTLLLEGSFSATSASPMPTQPGMLNKLLKAAQDVGL